MKPSKKNLGLELQLFLIRNGLQIDDMAHALGMTADGLSNLIHGRRRFRDEMLHRMASLDVFKTKDFSITRMKALRALDEYQPAELAQAILELLHHRDPHPVSPALWADLLEAIQRHLSQQVTLNRKMSVVRPAQSFTD